MQRDVQRLLRRVAILAVLVTCTVLVTAERRGNTVLAVNYCGYCSSFQGQCYNHCQGNYNQCVQNGGQNCNDELYFCASDCDGNYLFCTQFCNTGGGGGSGPWPKGTCGANCYDDRVDCLFGDPPEWIEDCLNEGGNRHTCCNTVFYDCMAGC